MSWALLTAGVFSALLPCSSREMRQLTVQDVLDRWEAGAELVGPYDLKLKSTVLSLVDPKIDPDRLLTEDEGTRFYPCFSHIQRRGAKRRGVFKSDDQTSYGPPMIWDGETAYAFQGDRSVTLDNNFLGFGSHEYDDYESSFRYFSGTIDRIKLSRARKSKLLPREGRLYVVDVPTANDGDLMNVRWRVWLDPERNYLPVRMTQWVRIDGTDFHVQDLENTLKEVEPGVWAPVRVLRRIPRRDPKSPLHGKIVSICTLDVIEEESRFQADLPDSLFDVTIPNGATVVDRRRNVVYTQGAEDPDKYLAQLAADEKKKLAGVPGSRRKPPQLVFLQEDRVPAWTWWAVSVCGGMVVLVAAFLIRRFVRR